MSEYDNLNIVKEIYSAQRGRNIPALLDFLANEVRWFSIGPPGIIPTAGTRYGREQVKQYFETLDGMEELENCEPREFIVQGDKVVAIGDLQRYVPATDSRKNSPWIHVFTLEQGKITEFRSFYDTAATIAALEKQPSPASRVKYTTPRRSFQPQERATVATRSSSTLQLSMGWRSWKTVNRGSSSCRGTRS